MFISICLALFGLGFLTESIGLFAHELNLALAVVCLGLSAAWPCGPELASSPRWPRAGWVVAGAGMLLLPVPLELRGFAAALWFGGLSQATRMARRRLAWGALAFGCIVSGLAAYAEGHSLIGWYIGRWLSAVISGLTSGLSGNEVTIGATFNGLPMLVPVVGAFVGVFLIGTPRRNVAVPIGLGATLAAYVVFLVLFAWLPDWIPAPDAKSVCVEWLRWGYQRFYPTHALLPLPALLAIPLAMVVRRGDAAPAAAGRRWVLAASPIAAMMSVWAMTNVPAPASPGNLTVAFHKEGFLNWMTPDHRMYGSRSGGMFGNLPLLIERMGGRAEIVPEITPAVLAGHRILCIFNQKDPLPPQTVDQIEQFVRGGGSLLVLGDHTNWKGEHGVLINQPIKFTNIRFAFDSAYYFIGGWLHSLGYRPHQMTATLGDEKNEAGCVVGASLDLVYPAAPLIIGRFGWSDPGVETATTKGFMGNSGFDPGEPLGDLVLVAAQNVGRGRVVVVGDTSGFVNAIQTQTWPFTHRVFYWLAGTGRAALPGWRDLLGLLLLLAAGALWALEAPRRAAVTPALCAAMLAAGLLSRSVVHSAAPPPPLKGKVAAVDLSHVGVHSVEGWRENGISGVYMNLMREGWFSIGLPRFDVKQVEAADIFVTIAPTIPYSEDEVDVLRRFVERGGALILAAGWDDRAGAQSLLDMAGLRLTHRPLGRASTNVPGATVVPQFWTAWPVLGGEPLVSLRGDPTVVRKRLGRGHVIVIGDSNFLLNRNLETEDGGIVPNIQFFAWLLKQAVPEAAP